MRKPYVYHNAISTYIYLLLLMISFQWEYRYIYAFIRRLNVRYIDIHNNSLDTTPFVNWSFIRQSILSASTYFYLFFFYTNTLQHLEKRYEDSKWDDIIYRLLRAWYCYDNKIYEQSRAIDYHNQFIVWYL